MYWFVTQKGPFKTENNHQRTGCSNVKIKDLSHVHMLWSVWYKSLFPITRESEHIGISLRQNYKYVYKYMLGPVHTVWFATTICFASYGLYRHWLCCHSHIVRTLPLSPVHPICCDKRNRSRNQKKTHNVNGAYVLSVTSVQWISLSICFVDNE